MPRLEQTLVDSLCCDLSPWEVAPPPMQTRTHQTWTHTTSARGPCTHARDRKRPRLPGARVAHTRTHTPRHACTCRIHTHSGQNEDTNRPMHTHTHTQTHASLPPEARTTLTNTQKQTQSRTLSGERRPYASPPTLAPRTSSVGPRSSSAPSSCIRTRSSPRRPLSPLWLPSTRHTSIGPACVALAARRAGPTDGSDERASNWPSFRVSGPEHAFGAVCAHMLRRTVAARHPPEDWGTSRAQTSLAHARPSTSDRPHAVRARLSSARTKTARLQWATAEGTTLADLHSATRRLWRKGQKHVCRSAPVEAVRKLWQAPPSEGALPPSSPGSTFRGRCLRRAARRAHGCYSGRAPVQGADRAPDGRRPGGLGCRSTRDAGPREGRRRRTRTLWRRARGAGRDAKLSAAGPHAPSSAQAAGRLPRPAGDPRQAEGHDRPRERVLRGAALQIPRVREPREFGRRDHRGLARPRGDASGFRAGGGGPGPSCPARIPGGECVEAVGRGPPGSQGSPDDRRQPTSAQARIEEAPGAQAPGRCPEHCRPPGARPRRLARVDCRRPRGAPGGAPPDRRPSRSLPACPCMPPCPQGCPRASG